MTELKDIYRKEDKKVEVRHSTFACAACGSGGESFSHLFSDGTCNKCGNPATAVVEISHPVDMEKIKKSILVIYPDLDKEIASKIISEMADRAVQVIDPRLIVDNQRAGDRANTLAFLAEHCKYILVIPTSDDQFSGDRLVSAAVEGVFMNTNKVLPLYPDMSYREKSSVLVTRRGINWFDSSDREGASKEQFLKFVKQD